MDMAERDAAGKPGADLPTEFRPAEFRPAQFRPAEFRPAEFRVVSGGQTGADRGALDAALDAGVACGGWCPAERWAEDGPIAARYPLAETPDSDPLVRTRRNVADADGTLILTLGAPDAGTEATVAAARALGRPRLEIDLSKVSDEAAASKIAAWIAEAGIRTLNVAGPRESHAPGLQDRVRDVLGAMFARTKSARR
jgi:hypothetical protein